MNTTKIRTLIATLAAAFTVAAAVAPVAQAKQSGGGNAPADWCGTMAESIANYRALYYHEKAHDPNSDATAKAKANWEATIEMYEENCVAQTRVDVIPAHILERFVERTVQIHSTTRVATDAP